MSEEKFEGKSSDEGWLHLDYKDIEIGEKIGGGGVGIIYNGWFGETPVAVKKLMDTRLDENLKKEYLDELLVMSRLKHSNIVKFIGASMSPPDFFICMELCEVSLFNLLYKQNIAFSTYEVCQIGLDVASAMEYLHAQRPPVCHRDLKSHNILKSYDGVFKICDFGLVSNKNPTAGTPNYMAPELLSNKSFNKSVDIYSFGILLCEIFDGKLPFHSLSVQDIINRVLDGDRPYVPGPGAGCPERCAKLIRKCWSQSWADRPEFPVIVDELIDLTNTIPETKHSENLNTNTHDALDSLFHK